ncbi:MAG: SAM-dependent methyltransferase [endosymbiont of Seepiophila jonesi]|uniref:SAM-dependent methyltransferase n=1 Tax=endosymbiont of Lamellibrachia luymesi TaxID=2200907 RepID=A0A370E0G2_9GAMM|nr:MAG: SAM-dependent methyltransferase [endosymbiont of Seepiophila jonesi]RDH92900.1 MAG: SAM-dependent methyltransferase [endosymbiont of Lamellibrachia luymesi]
MSDCLQSPHHSSPNSLPSPDAAALAVSEQLERRIRDEMEQTGGAIPFNRFMELALYAPGLGYYVAGSRKFGEAGDFITAPEISPLFARCLARSAQQLLAEIDGGAILEFGAGSGLMAADMLAELERLDALPQRYLIMEVSPELQARQRETITRQVPELSARVEWLDRLPDSFSGLVVANELLDAMPVHRFRIRSGCAEESFVAWDETGFVERFETAVSPDLDSGIERIQSANGALAEGYVSEVNLRLHGWMKAMGAMMERGAVLLVDYGYPRSEFFHLQRTSGTLMCHYRHRAHPDPFRWVGLQDITAHVDFTAVAESGVAAGFELLGYTTQAHFLMASGLDSLLAGSDPNDLVSHMELVQGVKRLTLPSEMGERFKVLGLSMDAGQRLSGFSLRDLRDRL